MFNWEQGKSKSNGANSTVYPRTYRMINEDFGEEVAAQYLALCESNTGELTGVTVFSETAEARKFRQELDWS